MTEINNRIEEVKKILDANTTGGYFLRTTTNFTKVARQICQLFPQPLDDKALERKIDDILKEGYLRDLAVKYILALLPDIEEARR